MIWAAAGFALQKQAVPEVNGGLGECSADFSVLDQNGEPLYDAKVNVSFRHGFLWLRRMSLQVGTNSEGRARVAGLPDKTFRFEITAGILSETVSMNASDECNAEFEVVLDKD